MSKSRPTASEFASSAYDAELEREFFSRVRADKGWKTTEPGRLDDVNEATRSFIRDIPERPLDIMDVGASSGITTEEWSDQLASWGIAARLIGTDVCLEAHHFRGKFIEAVLDRDSNVIHLGLCNRGITGSRTIFQAPVEHALSAIVRLSIAFGAETKPFRLESKAMRLVRLVEDDIGSDRQDYVGQFHVVRAANLFNLNHFPPQWLTRAAHNLVRRLRPSGLLIVCRTHRDGTNHATLFKRRGSRLRVIMRLGDGSEMEPVLLSASALSA